MIIGGGQAGLAVGLPPGEARSALRDPGRERADRRLLAQAMGLAARVHPRALRRAAGLALPGAGLVVPHQGRGGRLPGGLCGPVRSSRSHRRPRGRALQGGRPVRRDGRATAGSRPTTWWWHRARTSAPGFPAFAAELDPGIVQLHSSEYRNPSQLQDGGVLVVGAGNSGAEIALEVVRRSPDLAVGQGHRARNRSAPEAGRTGWSRR